MRYYTENDFYSSQGNKLKGRISFLSNSYMFIKCNGRRVFAPLKILTNKEQKDAYVGKKIEFELGLDENKKVYAKSAQLIHEPMRVGSLYKIMPDAKFDAIKIKDILQVNVSNLYKQLDGNLRELSDEKGIPISDYDIVSIVTKKNGDYIVTKKNSPIKGCYQVDNIEEFVSSLYGILSIGDYEPIESLEEVETNKKDRELSKVYQQESKDRMEYFCEIYDPEALEHRNVFGGKWDGFSVSYRKIKTSIEDQAEYEGLTKAEYVSLAKECGGSIVITVEDDNLYENEEQIVFGSFTKACSFAKKLVALAYAHEKIVEMKQEN